MTIDRIGSLESLQPGKKPGMNNRINGDNASDSISLSSEALERGEFHQAVEMASTVSDVRLERIEELKRKINDPSYINDTVIQGTADKIMEAFGL